MTRSPEAPWSAGSRWNAFWLGTVFMNGIARSRVLTRALRGPSVLAAWAFSEPLRRATLANAKRVLGAQSSDRQLRGQAKRFIATHYQFIADLATASRQSIDAMAARIGDVRGREHFDAAHSTGRGLIFVTAHLGSFEVGTAAMKDRVSAMHVVFMRDPFAVFERYRAAVRRTLGVVEAPIDDGMQTWMRLREALERGEVVLMQADRTMGKQRSLRAPFLGGHADFPVGPFQLAAMTGALVLPVFAILRADGLVDIEIDEPIETPDGESIPDGVRRGAESIERRVRKYPDQWLAAHPVCVEDQ